MDIKIKTLIIPSIITYLLLATKFSFRIAGAFLLIIIGFVFVKIYFKKIKKGILPFKGIKSVPKELVFNNNTLSNNYCIVRYFQNRKIVVMDNPLAKNHTTLRAFVADKTNHENITNCWEEICSVYDEYTSLDTLFSFIDKASGRLCIMFLCQEEGKFALEGMEEFLPKPKKRIKEPEIKNKKLAQKIEQSKRGQIIVEFDDLKQQEIPNDEGEKVPENVINMHDLTDGNKIDVNLANAQTISELPGINIVMAKKIVEYRNLNGFFKNKDEFMNILEVKDHFKNKIISIITVEKSSAVVVNKETEAEKERTVD